MGKRCKYMMKKMLHVLFSNYSKQKKREDAEKLSGIYVFPFKSHPACRKLLNILIKLSVT